MPKTPRKAESDVVGLKEAAKKSKKADQDPPTASLKPDQVLRAVVEYEEKEAECRSGEDDLKAFKQTCAQIRNILSDILHLKLLPQMDDRARKQIEEKKIEASLLFVTLKKLNRLDKLRLKKARDGTYEAKQRVDTFHLQLENLLYEVFHLRKEVGRCHEFKSKDEDIELVSVEEFYQEAPPSISKPESTRNDRHKLTLARLEWEFEQRKRLSEQCRSLEQNREKVVAGITSRQKQLESLGPRLNAILEATRPLQEELNMPLERIRFQKELAALLPDPLYILYSQLKAYIEACDAAMQVTIQGEMDDARSFGVKSKTGADENLEDVDSDSDLDNDDDLVNKRTTACSTQTKPADSALSRHPLRILLTVGHISITFSYVVTMNIITVATKSSSKDESSSLPLDNLLSALFPNDYGDESPNIVNGFQTKSITHHQIAELGKPYLWAQRLAGLDFCSAVKAAPKSFVNSAYVDQVVQAIKDRIDNRLELNRILHNLSKGDFAVNTGETGSIFPSSISTRLCSWNPITSEECHRIKSACSLLEFMEIDPKTAMFYKAILERNSAKLSAVVVIPMDYPKEAPFFSLELHWHGVYDRVTSEDIRQIEAEVNVFYEELPSAHQNNLLIEQLRKLAMMLDVLTEIDGQLLVRGQGSRQNQNETAECSTEKMIPFVVKGHNRSRPFKYDHKTRFFLHR